MSKLMKVISISRVTEVSTVANQIITTFNESDLVDAEENICNISEILLFDKI